MAILTLHLIYLLLFFLPWQTRLILRPGQLNGSVWEYGQVGIFAMEILLWLIVVVWLMRGQAAHILSFRAKRSGVEESRSRLERDPSTALGMTFIVPLLVYYFFISPDKLLTTQTFAHYAAAFALFLILKNLESAQKKTAALAFIVGVSLQAVLGIYQFLTQSAFASRLLGMVAHGAWAAGSAVIENAAGRFLRAYGGLPHPNILGGYLAVSLILMVGITRHCEGAPATEAIPPSRLPRGLRPLAMTSIFWAAYILQTTTLFFTFSRGAWLAFAAAAVMVISNAVRNPLDSRTGLWGISRFARDDLAAVVLTPLIIFTIFSLLFQPLLVSRLAGVDRLEAASKNERLSQYGEAWQLIKARPWLGSGPGLYTLALHQLKPDKPVWSLQPVHNIFVLALAEWGIIGLGLVVLVITRGTLQGAPFKGHPLRVTLALVLIILGLFDHYLLSLWSGVMLLSVASALSNRGLKKRPP